MEGYELPLKALPTSSGEYRMLIRSTKDPKVIGSPEPWFDVSIISAEERFSGARATQPLSCLQAVLDGRKTALMCKAGILALYLDGEVVRVDFQSMSGEKLYATCAALGYRRLIDSLRDGPDKNG